MQNSAPFKSSLPLSLSLAFFALLASGCGTGTYTEMHERYLAEVREVAPYAVLHGYGPIEGTPVKVRVPLVFTSSYQKGSPDPTEPEKPIDPRRLQPSFFSFPGYKQTYEAYLNVSDYVKFPMYCYLAVLPATEENQNLPAELHQKLKQRFDKAPDWETVECPTPDKSQMSWQKVRVNGEIVVESDQSNVLEYQTVPGTFELWLHQSQGYYVMIGWMIPDQISSQFNLDNVAPLVAGTVVIEPNAEPAQPEG